MTWSDLKPSSRTDRGYDPSSAVPVPGPVEVAENEEEEDEEGGGGETEAKAIGPRIDAGISSPTLMEVVALDSTSKWPPVASVEHIDDDPAWLPSHFSVCFLLLNLVCFVFLSTAAANTSAQGDSLWSPLRALRDMGATSTFDPAWVCPEALA